VFGFSFGELVVIGLVALVALGPENLPRMMFTIGRWLK
jgi:sec-independent protein translocase protein TatB